MDFRWFQDRLLDIARRTREIDLRGFEKEGSTSPAERAVPHIRETLLSAESLLRQLAEFCQPRKSITDEDHLPVFPQTDGWMSTETVWEELVRAASEGVAELAGCLALLDDVARRPPHDGAAADAEAHRHEILSNCFRCQRKALEIVKEVDRAIAQATGLEPRLDFASELEAALAIRRAWAEIRRAVSTPDEPDDANLRDRLQNASSALAKLRAGEAFRIMRYHDRIGLEGLQQGLLDWNHFHGGRVGSREGLRLWQEVADFTRNLGQVNRRAELREHDRKLVEEVHARLDATAPASNRLSEELFHRLEELHGCDEEIEDLLEGHCLDLETWRHALERRRATYRR